MMIPRVRMTHKNLILPRTALAPLATPRLIR